MNNSAKRLTQILSGEAIQSAVHYGLNLTLVAILSPKDYGVFSLVFLAAGVALSYLNSLAGTVLQVHLPRLPTPAGAALEATLSLVSLALATATFVVCAFSFAWSGSSTLFSLLAAGVITSWPVRQFVKSRAYAAALGEIPLRMDLAYAATCVAALLFMSAFGALNLTTIFGALLTANALAGTYGWIRLEKTRPVHWQAARWKHYRAVLSESAWATLGNTATTAQGYGYAFIVVSIAGPAALAPISAGFALFGPARVAVGAWQSAVRAELSAKLADRNVEALRQMLRASTQLACATGLAGGVLLLLAWPFLSTTIFQNYGNDEIAIIVAGWAVCTLLFALRAIPSIVLQSSRNFRALTHSINGGALISLSLTAAATKTSLLLIPVAVALSELYCLADQARLARGVLNSVHNVK